MSQLHKLIEISSPAIRMESPDQNRLQTEFGDSAARHITAILSQKNGFYTFEGSLHVFPDASTPPERGLFEWNHEYLWKAHYQGMADDTVCFAEDAFGTQFCIRKGVIGTFDPETGEFEAMAESAEDWAKAILEDYSYWSGYVVAREWRARHGRLPQGNRLVPTTPFVLGGAYEAENVGALDAVRGMKFRASIAVQIRNLPDGAQIQLQVVE